MKFLLVLQSLSLSKGYITYAIHYGMCHILWLITISKWKIYLSFGKSLFRNSSHQKYRPGAKNLRHVQYTLINLLLVFGKPPLRIRQLKCKPDAFRSCLLPCIIYYCRWEGSHKEKPSPNSRSNLHVKNRCIQIVSLGARQGRDCSLLVKRRDNDFTSSRKGCTAHYPFNKNKSFWILH